MSAPSFTAQQKMYCITMLKRSKVSNTDSMHNFCSKCRPILKYGAPIWHGGLTQEQENALEDIQMRACKIAVPDQEYHAVLQHVGIPTPAERRLTICKVLFCTIQNPQDKLHKMLPPIKENVCNTRQAKPYPLPKTLGSRYKN